MAHQGHSGGGHGSHHHGHGFLEALGFVYLMRFPPFKFFVLGVILYAVLKGG